jgi:hypothetical protein
MLGNEFVRKFPKIARWPWLVVALMAGLTMPVRAQPAEDSACPDRVAPLLEKILTDLPEYANREFYRAVSGDRSTHYMLVAGRPEFDPLPLPGPQSDLADTRTSATEDVRQVFFTTLERQYQNGRSLRLQQYHWAFLAPTSDGWRLILMFSRTGGSSPDTDHLSPIRNSSHSAIAEAIRLWLRDNCRF